MPLEVSSSLILPSASNADETPDDASLAGGAPSNEAFQAEQIFDDAPLPESYATDLIYLLPQSPGRLFLHWNLARDPIETLRRAIGQAADEYRIFVRLTNESRGEESFHDVGENRTMWFDVAPGATYRAEIVLRAADHPIVHLLASDAVTTPSRTVAPMDDEELEFHIEPARFAQALRAAGYQHDALALLFGEKTQGLRAEATAARLKLSAFGEDQTEELRRESISSSRVWLTSQNF